MSVENPMRFVSRFPALSAYRHLRIQPNSGGAEARSDNALSPIFNVLSLDVIRFEQECNSLMQRVACDFRPDVIVAIRTGGVFVAEAMARAADSAPPVLAITCRRPSTEAKQRATWIKALLTLLPRSLLDLLRLVEHRLLTRQQAGSVTTKPYVFDGYEQAALVAWLRAAGPAPSLLVVDDAVDSGETLSHVLALLAGLVPPEAVVRSAVITVTTVHPIAQADYTLYHRQLCRFPWSHDA